MKALVKRNSSVNVLNSLTRTLTDMMVANLAGGRSTMPWMTGLGYGAASNPIDTECRDLDKECGYILGEPTVQQYNWLYENEGIATRIVSVYPDECWSVFPEVYEREDDVKTKFERAWDDFQRDKNPFHYLHRLDELSGIGQYGIMVLGFADGKRLDQIAPGINEKGEPTGKVAYPDMKLAYMQVYSQQYVRIKNLVTDPRNPRFGQPQAYIVKIGEDFNKAEALTVDEQPDKSAEVEVHWSRVVHFAENVRGGIGAFGTPRLKNLHRRVVDIRKVLGGAGEMFWKGGFPGISFEAYPELTDEADVDMASIKDEIDAYANGLRRYMRLIGMQAKSLAPQVADPKSTLTENYRYICATTATPMHILLGSEGGQTAGEKDVTNWYRRIGRRQVNVNTPFQVKPFVNRLQFCGVLPRTPGDRFVTEYKDLNQLTEQDRADVALKRAQAILQYVTSGATLLIRPKQFMMKIMKFSEAESEAIIQEHGGEDGMLKKLEDVVDPMAGNTPNSTNISPTSKTGAGGKRNSLGRGAKNKTRSTTGGQGRKGA